MASASCNAQGCSPRRARVNHTLVTVSVHPQAGFVGAAVLGEPRGTLISAAVTPSCLGGIVSFSGSLTRMSGNAHDTVRTPGRVLRHPSSLGADDQAAAGGKADVANGGRGGNMLKTRTETWAALIVLAVMLFVGGILGLWGFMGVTATPLHPNPQTVPSVTHLAPLPAWVDTVEGGRQLVRASLTEQNVPGLSVAVGVGRDIVWAEGFGWADLERKVKVAPDTRFRIGTASTVLTSAAVGLLLERDRLKLDDVIQTYVPGFPEKQWPVTLRQLMGHMAGVRNDGGDEGPLLSARCERPVEALGPFAKRSLLFEPGTQYRYSSYGWILVSAAVEAAADEPFLTFMQTSVFEPLG